MATQKKATVKSSDMHKHITEVIGVLGKDNLSKYSKKKKVSKESRVLKDKKGTFKETLQQTQKGMKTIAE